MIITFILYWIIFQITSLFSPFSKKTPIWNSLLWSFLSVKHHTQCLCNSKNFSFLFWGLTRLTRLTHWKINEHKTRTRQYSFFRSHEDRKNEVNCTMLRVLPSNFLRFINELLIKTKGCIGVWRRLLGNFKS